MIITLNNLLNKVKKIRNVYLKLYMKWINCSTSDRRYRLYYFIKKLDSYFPMFAKSAKDTRSTKHLKHLSHFHRDLKAWLEHTKPWAMAPTRQRADIHKMFLELVLLFVEYTRPLLRYHHIRKSVTECFEQHHGDCRVGYGA